MLRDSRVRSLQIRYRLGCRIEQAQRINHMHTRSLREVEEIVHSRKAIAARSRDTLIIHRSAADAKILNPEVLKQRDKLGVLRRKEIPGNARIAWALCSSLESEPAEVCRNRGPSGRRIHGYCYLRLCRCYSRPNSEAPHCQP